MDSGGTGGRQQDGGGWDQRQSEGEAFSAKCVDGGEVQPT